MSGAYDGHVHFVRGEEGGGFEAPDELYDDTGALLCGGYAHDDERGGFVANERTGTPRAHAVHVATVDWEGDGDVDLLLGAKDGRIHLHRNLAETFEERPAAPIFRARGERIRYGKRSIWCESGNAAPLCADWDGDGRFDLLAGAHDGSVVWWRNEGVDDDGDPTFAAPRTLVEPSGDRAASDRPHACAQIAVHDLDGDGAVDLVVGERARVGDEVRGQVWWFRRRGAPGAAALDER